MKIRAFKDRANRTIKNYMFILKIIWDATPQYMVFMVVLIIIQSLLPVVNLILSKEILNALVYPEKNNQLLYKVFSLLGCIALSYVILSIIDGIKSLISALMLNIVGKKITYIIQKKASTLDMKFFDTPDYYYKLENARRVLGRNWNVLLGAPMDIFGGAITLISMIGLLASLNIWIVPIVLIGVIPNIIVQIKIRKKEVQFYSEQIPETRKINYVENLLSNRLYAKEVRIFGLGDFFIKMSQDLFQKQFKKIKHLKTGAFKQSILYNLISIATMIGCQGYIAAYTLLGKITVGDWQLYSSATQSIQTTLKSIFTILAMSYEEELYTNILMEFLNTKPEIEMDEGKKYSPHKKIPVIEFKHVSFSYPKATKPVLDGMDFSIKPGEKIALVGLNGAGKSTIIKLLTRLYDPVDGQILFDGVDVREYKSRDIYKLFGIVFQDYSKYAFTLAENIGISYLDKMNDTQSIEKAAKHAGVDSIAKNLPNKFDTYITKEFDINGFSNLSGGEWQKIAIARAFFRDASIVILDEPTASLDAKAEYEIYKQFVKLCKDRTAILISHRLSSARLADKILMIDNGKVIESGSHHELIRLDGEYSKLFKLQADKYKISPNGAA